MPVPWLALGLTAGGGLLRRFLNKQDDLQFANEPAKYKDDLVLDDSDVSGLRGAMKRAAGEANLAQVGGIKQAGAAKRLPSGAILSALAGSSQKAAQGVAQIEPQLEQMKTNSLKDFLRMQQPYDMARAQNKLNQQQSSNMFNQEMFGNLGKIAILWRAGFFDNDTLSAAGIDPGMLQNVLKGAPEKVEYDTAGFQA